MNDHHHLTDTPSIIGIDVVHRNSFGMITCHDIPMGKQQSENEKNVFRYTLRIAYLAVKLYVRSNNVELLTQLGRSELKNLPIILTPLTQPCVAEKTDKNGYINYGYSAYGTNLLFSNQRKIVGICDAKKAEEAFVKILRSKFEKPNDLKMFKRLFYKITNPSKKVNTIEHIREIVNRASDLSAEQKIMLFDTLNRL